MQYNREYVGARGKCPGPDAKERMVFPMEKRRVRLEINGVVCGLITQESDAYMRSLAEEVGDVMQEILK